MKAISIQDQPLLSFRRTVTITANGVRYRLFRSLVTVVVVAVAVAFLMNILSESLIRRAIARQTARRIAETRCAATWAGYLTNPGTVEEILLRMAKGGAADPVEREASAMAGLSPADLAAFRAAARHAAAWQAFFADLDYARRRALVHTAAGVEIFDRLQDPAHLARFRDALKTMRSVQLPSSLPALEEFLRHWPKLKEQTERLRQSRAREIATLAERTQGRPLLEALADADGAFGKTVRAAGFGLDEATARQVAEQARRTLDVRRIERSVSTPEMRQAVAGYLDLMPNDVNVTALWDLLRDSRAAAWYAARQKETRGEAEAVTADRLVELAKLQAETESLNRAERMTLTTGGFTGSGERMDWLVIASMLVCVVGISNSMLMSVTERFREIATLKCLGALDGFIMLTFVLEAAFLGVVGGMAGALLGTLLGIARMIIPFGSLVGASLPVGQLVAAIAISTMLGVILAAIAAVYPSLKAARLAPMEAMRIQ